MAKLSSKFSLGGILSKERVAHTKNVTELVKSLLEILGTVGPVLLALLGVGSNISGQGVGFAVSLAGAPFPIRLMVFILISIGLGWSLAALMSWFSTTRNEATFLSAHLLALVLASLMVGSADWLAPSVAFSRLPQEHFFGVVGLGIVFSVLRFRFRAGASYGGQRLLYMQSGIILTFAASAFMILLLLDTVEA